MRYFFHVRRDGNLLEDPEGIEFDGLDTVREEAFAGARDMLAERLKDGRSMDVNMAFEIYDANGELVLSLSFAEVLLSSIAPAGIPRIASEAAERSARAY